MELFENADGGGGIARYPSRDGTDVGVGSGVGSMIRVVRSIVSKKSKGGRVDALILAASQGGLRMCVCVVC